MLTVFAAAATALEAPAAAGPAPSAVSARSVSSFINSLGVGAHIDSGSAQWTNAPLLLQQLDYLGISNVRDGTPFDYALPTFITLAQAGIRFNLLEANVYSFDQTGIVNAQIDVARAHQLEAAVPGSVISFEGTNEYTTNHYLLNGSGSFGNLGWGLQDAQQLQLAVRADPLFADTPILAPSAVQLDSLPNFSAYVDGANAHIYGNVGEQLQDRIVNSVRFAQASAPGEPVYITEIGVSTSGYGSSTWGVTDEDTQAIINLNALLGGYHAGAAMTFIYELMDEPYASNLQEQHFGLFHADGTPKPAATAIGNLTHILADDGTGTAPLGSLAYSLDGLPAGASSFLLQKSNGAFDLVVWNGRATLYDGTQEVTPPATTVTLNLAQAAASIQLFDPVLGAAAQVNYANASSASFALGADPIIVEVRMDSTPSAHEAPAASNVAWLSGTSARVSGSADPGSAVSVFEGSTLLGSARADGAGTWALTLPGSSAAQHRLSLTALSPDGVTTAAAGVLLYGKSKQVLTGGAGDDVLIGASGDRLVGGAGSDTFVFNAGPGKEVIADFDPNADRIHMSSWLAADFADLMSHARQSGSSVVISLTKSDVLTLEHVSLAALDASDFLFF